LLHGRKHPTSNDPAYPFLEVPPTKAVAMKIREATIDDAMDILVWRNDPLTRQMSRHTGAIAKENHLTWFAKALGNAAQLLLVAMKEGVKVGMVRFDLIAPGIWKISINLNPSQRRKGYSHQVLAAALDFIGARSPTKVIAEIRHENEVSRHLFEGYGFRWTAEREGFDSFELSKPRMVEKIGNVR
jgi:ribosomal protein S18 acetylase RimI-like enzyme